MSVGGGKYSQKVVYLVRVFGFQEGRTIYIGRDLQSATVSNRCIQNDILLKDDYFF